MITQKNQLSHGSIRLLLDLADATTRGQIFFALCVGATAAEVDQLRWSDVDLRNQKVWLEDQSVDLLKPCPRLMSLPSVLTWEMWELRTSTDSWAANSLVWEVGEGGSEARWARLFSAWASEYRLGHLELAPPVVTPDWSALRSFTVSVLLSRGIPLWRAAQWCGLPTDLLSEVLH